LPVVIRRGIWRVGLVVAALGVGLAPASRAATVIHKDHDPDILWKLISAKCSKGTKPCVIYDHARGIALLHSLEGRGQYLLIPTDKVAGMESTVLLRPETPNYFAEAWSFRDRVGAAYGHPVPDRLLALSINSSHGRSQNQLHIHLDCVDPEVRATLDRYGDRIGPSWSFLPVPLGAHRYRALYLSTLNGSPFRILAGSLAHPEQEMGDHTLVLVPLGAGYALLDDVAHDDDHASGEELQDHACHVLDSEPRSVP